MMQDSAVLSEIDFYPNISKESSDFFQTDKDLENEVRIQQKQQKFKNAGNPVKTPSKILYIEPIVDVFTGKHLDFVYVAESGFIARKIELSSGKSIEVFKGHTGPVTCVRVIYSSNGSVEFIVTSSWDKMAIKWDVNTLEPVVKFSGHSDFVKSLVCFERNLFTASSDRSIRYWDLKTGETTAILKGHTRAVEDLVVDYDSCHLYSSSSDTTIRKWDISSKTCIGEFKGHETSVYGLHFSDGALWSGI